MFLISPMIKIKYLTHSSKDYISAILSNKSLRTKILLKLCQITIREKYYITSFYISQIIPLFIDYNIMEDNINAKVIFD